MLKKVLESKKGVEYDVMDHACFLIQEAWHNRKYFRQYGDVMRPMLKKSIFQREEARELLGILGVY